MVLLSILSLSSCQSFNALVKEPGISFNSVDITGISLSGVDMVAHVDVDNPNAFSIPLPKVDWQLFINTASFIQGSLKKDQTIKGGGKVTLDLPLSVTYDGLYRSFKSLIETKEAAYDIALGITFPIPVLESKVYHLNFSGVLPLPQLPKLSLGSMRISKIDFSGLELAWDINVANPNGFSIPFPKINWDYNINDVPVVKSSFAGTGEIAAGAAAVVPIIVSVAYTDVFRAVCSLVNEKEARSNLSLDTGFPIPVPALDGDAVTNGLKSVLDIPGTLPILQKPEVSFRGIINKSIGATMEFVLNWEVDNRNNFGFDIGEFNYNFMVNNNNWARGRMNNPPRIAANGKTVIPLTVSVSALSVVAELVNIISRGTPVAYNCTGNMSLSGDFPGLEKLDLPLNLQGSTKIQ